jgi:multisubunit Na+/H+ antiporter MnhC subunit
VITALYVTAGIIATVAVFAFVLGVLMKIEDHYRKGSNHPKHW